MTLGVGGKTYQEALDGLSDMTRDIPSIPKSEFQLRISKATALMAEQNLAALYIHAGTSFKYFTGASLYALERLVGVFITADGQLEYLIPSFEQESLEEGWVIEGNINAYHESHGIYENFLSVVQNLGIEDKKIGFDEEAPFFIYDGVKQLAPNLQLVNGKSVTSGCRMQKSEIEIQIIQRAMDMTLEVHKAAASILHEGIKASTVKRFINEAHMKVGAPEGSYFALVLFGENTAVVHGVASEQELSEGDMVLIDTGCSFMGYKSDITRSYVFGEPSQHHRTVWDHEKFLQAELFDSAALGMPCGQLERVVQEASKDLGYGPEYQLPGIPHRPGHGIGLEAHERPYLMLNDNTPLDVGMCFSNEPTLCLPGKFGIRLEDHFYLTEDGPRWFTTPSHSIDNPFNLEET